MTDLISELYGTRCNIENITAMSCNLFKPRQMTWEPGTFPLPWIKPPRAAISKMLNRGDASNAGRSLDSWTIEELVAALKARDLFKNGKQ